MQLTLNEIQDSNPGSVDLKCMFLSTRIPIATGGSNVVKMSQSFRGIFSFVARCLSGYECYQSVGGVKVGLFPSHGNC